MVNTKLASLLALGMFVGVGYPVVAAPKPNIVFFLADDLGSADCGFMGGKECKSPNLDKLASSGTILEQLYVQPVCTPTRAALMTGRYPMRHGLQVGVIRPWANYGLPLDERTMPQALKEVGYNTGIFGKWHLGSFDKAYWPNQRGFDYAYGHLFGAIDYFDHTRDGKMDWYRNGENIKETGYSTHLLAKEAVKFVQSQSKDKPFFLYMPFNAVHSPYQVPDSYLQKFPELKGPRKTMAAMLFALDEAVGQVVDAIEAKGVRENTIFVFSSDNGGVSPGKVTDNGILRAGKGTLYEGGVRSTGFIAWDNHIPKNARSKAMMHTVDWFPTLLGVAGADVSSQKQVKPLDGMNMWESITAGKASPRTTVLMNTAPNKGAIRVGEWKLVLNGGASDDAEEAPKKGKKAAVQQAKSVELFNLKDDPSEKENLAAKFPDKIKELRKEYDNLAKQALPPKGGPKN